MLRLASRSKMLKALAHGLGVGTAAAGDSVKVMELT
jgi:hypothetical protein